MAEKLADSATRVVITGQQPGLVGGPLYTLSKALAAARWAARLEAVGVPAVAVFWVATEDHDFAEIARLAVPSTSGLTRWDLGEDPSPLTPVGMRTLGPAIDDVLASWREQTAAEDYRRWIDQVATWCRPDARFGEAFCRVMVGMMGEHCPLLADAMLPGIKKAQQTHLETLIRERQSVERALIGADEAIRADGFSLQVRPQRDTSPLFLLRGQERRRIVWKGEDRFSLRGLPEDEPVADLLQTAAENPAVISPGVLARPALQDAVFGSYLQILGPGELSYFPQAAPLYEILELQAPWVALRPQMIVLTGRQKERIGQLGLALADLAAGNVDASSVVMAHSGDDVVSPVLAGVERELAALEGPLMALDRNLEKPLEKTVAGIRRSLETLAGKAAAASSRQNETLLRRVQGVTDAVRPGGTLQERVVSGAHFVGRFEKFTELALDQLDLDPRRLHVVDPEDAP
jgi:bacillithiol biosynthesis cysteine-adding enzyme BshC